MTRYFVIAVLCGMLWAEVRRECQVARPTYAKTTMYVTDMHVSDPAPAAMVAEILRAEKVKDQAMCEDTVMHMRNLARCEGGI